MKFELEYSPRCVFAQKIAEGAVMFTRVNFTDELTPEIVEILLDKGYYSTDKYQGVN